HHGQVRPSPFEATRASADPANVDILTGRRRLPLHGHDVSFAVTVDVSQRHLHGLAHSIEARSLPSETTHSVADATNIRVGPISLPLDSDDVRSAIAVDIAKRHLARVLHPF